MSTAGPRQAQLRFGSQSWTLAEEEFVCSHRDVPPVADIQVAVDAALASPLDIASVDQAIVSGDIVAIAVDPSTPSLPQVVGGVARWLVEHGCLPENLRIVLADKEAHDPLQDYLRQVGVATIPIEVHDPDDVQGLSYLAADEEAQAIYLNRTLVDADVVIPIACAHSAQTLDYLGPGSVFNWFSSRETRGQLRSYARLIQPDHRESLRLRVEQASWWLAHCIAFRSYRRPKTASRKYFVDYHPLLSRRLSGSWSPGGWARNNLNRPIWWWRCWMDRNRTGFIWRGRCIMPCGTARMTVRSCSVPTSLGRSEPACGGWPTRTAVEKIQRRLEQDHSDDALAAAVILEATRDHHVYLVSRLSTQAVESLGMTRLADAAELSSLLHQYPHRLIICSAQHP